MVEQYPDNMLRLVNRSWLLLYIAYIFLPLIAGIDKFFDYLAPWNIYLNEAIPAFFHISMDAMMKIVGVVEIFASFLVCVRPKIGAMVVALWLVAIALNIFSLPSRTLLDAIHTSTMSFADIAVRDFGLAVGALVLSFLSKALDK